MPLPQWDPGSHVCVAPLQHSLASTREDVAVVSKSVGRRLSVFNTRVV